VRNLAGVTDIIDSPLREGFGSPFLLPAYLRIVHIDEELSTGCRSLRDLGHLSLALQNGNVAYSFDLLILYL
jgi:hypothetical protein